MRIQKNRNDLTKGMKKVAGFLLKEPAAFAANPARKVAEEIGVSETMVVRFCHALGYKGYGELQKEIRDFVFNLKNHDKEEHTDQETLAIYEKRMLEDQANIQQTAKMVDPQMFDLAVNKLAEAERILVAGRRSSFSMAHWFTFMLNFVYGKARLFRQETDIHLEDLLAGSVLVAFSFYRYDLDTLWLVEEAKKRGIFVIGFTDSSISPIVDYADALFPVQLTEQSVPDAAPVTFSLLNAIISGVYAKNPERANRHIDAYESRRLKNFFID